VVINRAKTLYREKVLDGGRVREIIELVEANG
jgi:hypothetical protein